RHQPRSAVSRTGNVEHVQVALADDAVEVDVDEVEAGRGAPVSEEAGLGVLEPERLAQERVIEQIDLPDGEIVRRAPVSVRAVKVVVREGSIRGHRQVAMRW